MRAEARPGGWSGMSEQGPGVQRGGGRPGSPRRARRAPQAAAGPASWTEASKVAWNARNGEAPREKESIGPVEHLIEHDAGGIRHVQAGSPICAKFDRLSVKGSRSCSGGSMSGRQFTGIRASHSSAAASGSRRGPNPKSVRSVYRMFVGTATPEETQSLPKTAPGSAFALSGRRSVPAASGARGGRRSGDIERHGRCTE